MTFHVRFVMFRKNMSRILCILPLKWIWFGNIVTHDRDNQTLFLEKPMARFQLRSANMTGKTKLDRVLWFSEIWCTSNQRNQYAFRGCNNFDRKLLPDKIMSTTWVWLNGKLQFDKAIFNSIVMRGGHWKRNWWLNTYIEG